MLYYLQQHIQYDKATVNDMPFDLESFCYKPISGEYCIVESPMQYFHDDLTILDGMTDADIKALSTCVEPLPGETRACFDDIGSPVLTFAIFGDTSCKNEATECD